MLNGNGQWICYCCWGWFGDLGSCYGVIELLFYLPWSTLFTWFSYVKFRLQSWAPPLVWSEWRSSPEIVYYHSDMIIIQCCWWINLQIYKVVWQSKLWLIRLTISWSLFPVLGYCPKYPKNLLHSISTFVGQISMATKWIANGLPNAFNVIPVRR